MKQIMKQIFLLFQNFNPRYNESLFKWFKYDDLSGLYEEIKNVEFPLNNILQVKK